MMPLIQQFAALPPEIQQEIQDYMDYIIAKRGIQLQREDSTPKWLTRVRRGISGIEKISDNVIKLRSEERW
jgi:hypothetical protein